MKNSTETASEINEATPPGNPQRRKSELPEYQDIVQHYIG